MKESKGMKKRILVLFVLFCVIFTEYSFAENNENNPIVEDEIVSGGSNVEEVLPPENQEIKDEKKEIKLNADKTTIVVTKTFTLKLINTTKNPVWSTSNKKVATVDKNGKVTGIKAGTVTITAKLNNIKYNCKVKVEKPVINYTKRTIQKGYKYVMRFTGTTLKPTWTSSNKSVATIDKNGKIIAKKKGTTKIKGSVGGKSYYCTVKVEDPSLNVKSKLIVKGKKYQLKVKGSTRKITWKSYSKKIATVSKKGLVTAKKAGKVKIVAVIGGIEYPCTITVVNKGLSKSSIVMTKGNKYTLKVYGLSGRKKWSSSKKSIATVSSNGVVTAKGKGTATITLKIGSKKYKCKVKVEAPTLSVSKTTIIEQSNSTFKISGTSKKVTWKTANSKIATVNSKGLVTGKKPGTVNITGVVDGRNFTYKITVRNGANFSGWIEKGNKELYYASGVPVTSWQKINGRRYCFNDKGELISKFGIDVSKYQADINWAKVKNDGVEFAMLRLGYRGYGKEGTLALDPKYKRNIEQANKYGIDCGVYFFTQAKTPAEGIAEAQYVLDNIKGYKVDYPIVIDTELSGADDNDGRADKLSKTQRTLAIKAFCETIKKAGRKPMIYASRDWFYNKLDMSKLSEYEVWVAHYTSGNTVTNYSGKYGIWQYTSSGKVSGIQGRVDMNVCLKKY